MNLPRGAPLAPGVTCMDAISQTVAGIRPGQMMEILSSMKVGALVATNKCSMSWLITVN